MATWGEQASLLSLSLQILEPLYPEAHFGRIGTGPGGPAALQGLKRKFTRPLCVEMGWLLKENQKCFTARESQIGMPHLLLLPCLLHVYKCE